MPRSETLRIKLETDGAGNLKASLAGVEQGLKGVDGASDRAGTSLGRTAVSARALAGIAGGVLAAGLIQLSRHTIQHARDIADLSESYGVAVPAMSQLANIAAVNGVEFGKFNAAVSALSGKVHDAIAAPSGLAAQQFRALNVEVKDANGNMRPLNDVLRDVARRFAEAADGGEKATIAGELFGRAVGKDMVPVLNRLEQDMGRVNASISNEFAEAANQFGANLGEAGAELKRFAADALTPVLKMLNILYQSSKDGSFAAALTGQIKTESDSFIGALTGMGVKVEDTREKIKALDTEAKKTRLSIPDADSAKRQLEENKRAAEELRREQEELRRVFEDTRTPMEALNIEFARLAELSNQGLDFDTYARAIFKAQEAADDSAESLRQMSREAALARQSIVDSLGDSLYQAMTGTFESTEDAFEDMLKRMAAKALAAGIVGALAGAGTSTGAWGGFVSGVAGAFGGGRAHGGDVSAGRAYLVGERGPEIIAPGQSGTVIPNHRLGGASVTVNQSFDFRGAQPGESLRLRAEAERIKAETIGEIFAQIERGGAAARIVGRA